ncbi:MAG: radical SAM protein [Anaerolineae bacterium]
MIDSLVEMSERAVRQALALVDRYAFAPLAYRVVYAGDRLPAAPYLRRLAYARLSRNWRSVKLHLTGACNLACQNCYADKRGQPLSRAVIEDLLDQLAGRHCRLDLLGGEPLLREDLLEIIEYARRRAGIEKIFLYTNGTRIDAQVARGLKDAGLQSAIVSLHSHQPQVHDALTQHSGAWEQTVSGIGQLLQAGVRTYSYTVVSARNVDQLDRMAAFSRELGAQPLFFPYIEQQPADPLASERSALKAALARTKPRSRQLAEVFATGRKLCVAFAHTVNIKVDGTVTPCVFVDLPLGNIKDQPLFEILRQAWQNPRLSELLSIPQECRSCAAVRTCGGGCKASRFTATGDTLSRDPRCLGPCAGPLDREALERQVPYLY